MLSRGGAAVRHRAHHRADAADGCPWTARRARSPRRCAFAVSRGAGRRRPSRATDVVVEWSPWRCSRSGSRSTASARGRLRSRCRPSTGATAPPASLTLPIGVDDPQRRRRRELTWQAGPARRQDHRTRVRLRGRRERASRQRAQARQRPRRARGRRDARRRRAVSAARRPSRSPATDRSPGAKLDTTPLGHTRGDRRRCERARCAMPR